MYELYHMVRVYPEEVTALLQVAAPIAAAHHAQATFMPIFPTVPQCLADRTLTNLGVRLVGINPSQQIVAHRDAAPPATLPFVRYHLPLQTNAGCWSFANGVWQQLAVGRVYRLDVTEVHGAVNWGETLRLHLMVDVEG